MSDHEEEYSQEPESRYYYQNQNNQDDGSTIAKMIGVFFAAISAIAAMYSIKANIDQNILNVENSVNERVKVVHEAMMKEVQHLAEMRKEDLERNQTNESDAIENLKVLINQANHSKEIGELQKITAEMKIEFQRVQTQFTGMKDKLGVEIETLQKNTHQISIIQREVKTDNAATHERLNHLEMKTFAIPELR